MHLASELKIAQWTGLKCDAIPGNKWYICKQWQWQANYQLHRWWCMALAGGLTSTSSCFIFSLQLQSFSAVSKSKRDSPDHLHWPSTQHLRCIRSEVLQSSNKSQGIWQPLCNGELLISCIFHISIIPIHLQRTAFFNRYQWFINDFDIVDIFDDFGITTSLV